MKNYENMEKFLERNLKIGTNWLNLVYRNTGTAYWKPGQLECLCLLVIYKDFNFLLFYGLYVACSNTLAFISCSWYCWLVETSWHHFRYYFSTQQIITCSKQTLEALEKICEICTKLTLKTPEWLQWRFFTSFSSASILDFEQVNICWVGTRKPKWTSS